MVKHFNEGREFQSTDGNCYINRELREKPDACAEEKGQTVTMALECILRQYFDSPTDKQEDHKK